jgi:FkbM family methyltransferase
MSHNSKYNIGKINRIVDKVRVTSRRVGMKAYHKTTEFNYKKQIVSRERRTPAGLYRSFELLSGHKSDLLLREISNMAGYQDTIYDIGAYSGDYTIPLARHHPNRTVIAFEPDKVTRRRLAKNLDENSVEDNVIVKPYGVGSTAKTKKFYRSSFRKTSSFNYEDATRWGADIIDTQKVQIKTIDNLCKILPSPDHIKIDAEGYAPEVLYGATDTVKDTKPIFYIEPHNRENADRTESILKWCNENDYRAEKKESVVLCRPS